jgi:hypothetical protein
VVTFANLLPYEQATHTAFRWWTATELAQSQESFMPPTLMTLLPPLLAGTLPALPLQVNCTP